MLTLYPFQKDIFDECLKLLSENIKNNLLLSVVNKQREEIIREIIKK
jgi:hypothetical protein